MYDKQLMEALNEAMESDRFRNHKDKLLELKNKVILDKPLGGKEQQLMNILLSDNINEFLGLYNELIVNSKYTSAPRTIVSITPIND